MRCAAAFRKILHSLVMEAVLTPAKMDTVRADLLRFCLPPLEDILHERYRDLFSDNESIGRVLRLSHATAWRFLITGDMQDFDAARAVLVGAARRSGVPEGFVDGLDHELMTELLTLVFVRHRGSVRTIGAYVRAATEIAGNVFQRRCLAAA